MGTDGNAGRRVMIGRKLSRTDTQSTGMTPNALLLCFSGKIGSGKTSTGMAVAEALGCGFTSFSNHLRNVATALGAIPIAGNLCRTLVNVKLNRTRTCFAGKCSPPEGSFLAKTSCWTASGMS